MYQALKRSIGNQSVEPEVVRMIMALAKTIGFTDTLFVSSAGDNSDGSSWDRAYTSLLTALDWIEANQAAGEFHCIMLQGGTWDLDTVGVPTYATNIAIYGCVDSRTEVMISNENAAATGVLQFTGVCIVENLTIECGTGETGINLNGGNASGSRLRKLHINCNNLAGAADGILLDGAVEHVKMTDIHVDGELGIANTTAIHFDEADHIQCIDLHLHNCFIGIHLDNAGDDNNEFYNVHLVNCATGIQIDGAGSTENFFEHIDLVNNAVNIDDNGTTTRFVNLHLAFAVETVSPDDVAGVLVVSGVGADTWTVGAVQIRAASATPFKIIGVAYECAVAEITGIRLYSDGGTNVIWQGIVETIAATLKSELFDEPIVVNQGLAIHARVKSEAGGNNCNIWLKIEVI